MYIYILFLFLLGSVMGSYLHATAYRYTKDNLDDFYEKHEKNKSSYFTILKAELMKFISTFTPVRSHCPVCNYQLKWYENIPILSYLLLKGKCSNCKTTIPIIYFFAEILLGIIYIAVFYKLNFIEHKDILYIITFLIYLKSG
jgi:prepilin signal peptidase PulO-like enzyme (type II secretory pathway)